MIVVADASPSCYLPLIGHVDLLQRLFGQVVIPQAVHDDLSAEGGPTTVRTSIAHPPSWLQLQYATTNPNALSLQWSPLMKARRQAEAIDWRQVGLVGHWDVVAFDEVAGIRVQKNSKATRTGQYGFVTVDLSRGHIECP